MNLIKKLLIFQDDMDYYETHPTIVERFKLILNELQDKKVTIAEPDEVMVRLKRNQAKDFVTLTRCESEYWNTYYHIFDQLKAQLEEEVKP